MAVKGVTMTMHMPSEISIRLSKKDEKRWILYYSESFDYDLPPEHAKLTISTMKKLGLDVRQDGRTFSYHVVDSKEGCAAMIATEFMANSRLGRMTINELFSLVALGVPNLPKKAKEDSVKKS